ncbi:MAG: hypothetical protein HOF33_08135 [Rhodospirillaceae bacterium]|nr:hypothetical protein [Rhodospirillaceae bacterium]
MFGKRKKENQQKLAARKVVEAERLRRAGDLEASDSACREALEVDPDHRASALAELGAVLSDQGRHEESLAAYEESLSEQADQPLVYCALAAMCLARGGADEALLLADKACELAPGLTSAKITRANVLDQLGRSEGAFDELSLAYRVAPRDVDNFTALTDFVARRGLTAAAIRQGAWQDCEAAVLGAFHAGCMNGLQIAAAAGAILCVKYDFSAGEVNQEQLSNDELFIRLLQECVNSNPVIEKFCAGLRRHILMNNHHSEELPTSVARLAAALALQSHNNGYVLWTDGEEEKVLAGEEQRLGEVIQAAKTNVTGATRAALQLYAMYRPLAHHADADTILDLPLGGEAGRLVLLTIREVRELTAASARVLGFVDGAPAPPGAQADGAIFPWTHFETPELGSLMAYLRRQFPGYSPPEWSAGACDILIPACGSGEQAAGLALGFPACRVFAIDLQRSALGYGARKALKLGLGNIEFAVGEVMAARDRKQRFHFIDARRLSPELISELAELLVPGGLMRLDVAGKGHAEKLASAFEFGARQAAGSLQVARRDICHAMSEACQYLCRQGDFYDLSNCLRLLAVAERGGSSAEDLLSDISRAGLRLIGQFASPDLRAGYRTSCPGDPLLENLTMYEGFMRENLAETGGAFRLLLQKPE